MTFRKTFPVCSTEKTNDDFETRGKKEDDKQASGNRTISGRIIEITIESVLCFLFIYLVIREIYLCCLFTQLISINTVSAGVDADIADVESIRTKCEVQYCVVQMNSK